MKSASSAAIAKGSNICGSKFCFAIL